MDVPSPRRSTVSSLVLSSLLVPGLAAGCSGGSSPADDVAPESIEAVVEVGAAAGLMLTELDSECVAIELGPIDPRTDSQAFADGVIECVGSAVIVESAIRPQTPGISDASIDCAAARVDDALVTELLVAQLEEAPESGPEVELELGAALAACLTPEELLDAD